MNTTPQAALVEALTEFDYLLNRFERASQGWRFERLDSGAAVVHTPGGGAIRLFRDGGGGVEHVAYAMAAMLATLKGQP